LGGFLVTHLTEMPAPGDSVEAVGYRFTVLDVRDRRIRRVLGELLPPPPETEE
jgi:CBS domain containing-hemolysin-like protein